MTDLGIKDKLYAPLTVDSRRGRGGTYGYVKWQNVADRMNEVFGMNWSSSVMSENIDEHNTTVVVRVSVCAKDPVSDAQYCQEGYGASTIRSSDEPGSAHKGAYSKALKDACKKWGIGLHLEDGNSATPASMPTGYTGHETGQPVPTAPPAPSTPVAPVVQETPTQQAPVPTPVAPVAPAPTDVYVAPTTAGLPTTPTAEMGLPATPAPAGVNPGAPAPAPSMTPPAPAPANSGTGSSPDTPGTITSVQDMAIQNLSRLNGVEGQTMGQFLQGLLDNPECELSRPVSTLNELSYNEAVCVIKAAKSL